MRGAQPNDSLFFHCEPGLVLLIADLTFELWCADSGHGGQTKDLDGDEADGYDEVIYPLDFKQVGHIVDDVRVLHVFVRSYLKEMVQLLHDIMVKPLPPGCRLTAIFDVSQLYSIYCIIF